jgi:hypothetical protein
MTFFKSDLPANGNILIINCKPDYVELKQAVIFCFAFASEKNGMHPDKWIDPVIVNSYYEGLFSFAFDGTPPHILQSLLDVLGGQESIKNTIIAYARGKDYFLQPVTLPNPASFNIKNEVIESSASNSNEKEKDIQTPSPSLEVSKQSTEFYIKYNGELIKIKNIIFEA